MDNERKIKNLKDAVLNLFFPRRCAVCNKITTDSNVICEDCDRDFERDYDIGNLGGVSLITACDYNEYSKPIILGAKTCRDGDKLDFMASEIANAVMLLSDCSFDYVIPIPMSKPARRRRGYSQTEKLAAGVHFLCGIPYLDAFIKTRDTREQKTLTGDKRLLNIRDCFSVSDDVDLQNKSVLIVDDVATTGATLSEAARVAFKAGCGNVVCAAFARAHKTDIRNFE